MDNGVSRIIKSFLQNKLKLTIFLQQWRRFIGSNILLNKTFHCFYTDLQEQTEEPSGSSEWNFPYSSADSLPPPPKKKKPTKILKLHQHPWFITVTHHQAWNFFTLPGANEIGWNFSSLIEKLENAVKELLQSLFNLSVMDHVFSGMNKDVR